jgi:hypothetical protein
MRDACKDFYPCIVFVVQGAVRLLGVPVFLVVSDFVIPFSSDRGKQQAGGELGFFPIVDVDA